MRRSRLALAALLILMAPLLPQALAATTTSSTSTASTAFPTFSVRPGDSATYTYVIKETNGPYQNVSANEETVKVDGINVTGPGQVGFVAYTEFLSEWNNTALSAPENLGSNVTAVFNPYVNATYYGEPWIGWYPFTYTGLQAGSGTNLPVNVTVLDIPLPSGNVTASGIVLINFTVTKTSNLIDINFNFATATATAAYSLDYNATTGWLETGTVNATAYHVNRLFTYNLVDYVGAKPGFNLVYLAYAIPVAIAAVMAYEIIKRKPKSARKASRMREKFTGKPS